MSLQLRLRYWRRDSLGRLGRRCACLLFALLVSLRAKKRALHDARRRASAEVYLLVFERLRSRETRATHRENAVRGQKILMRYEAAFKLY